MPHTIARAPSGGQLRRFLRGLGLQVAIILVTLGAIELVLRLADLRYLRDGARPGFSFVFRHDSELGWAPAPNAASTFTGTNTVAVRNNSIGLRDIEVRRGARPTILFVGDSFTWGFDVEAPDRFTDILRARMPHATIVNAGVPGYGTDQEYLMLRRLWDVVAPDVVVLMICGDNDRSDNSTNMRYDGYYKPYIEQGADGRWLFRGQPVPRSRHTYFVEDPLVRNLWLARVAVSAYVLARHPRITVADPTEHLIAMMRAFVEARGGKFLVGLQQTEAQVALARFLDASGIPYATFAGAETFADFGYHWTPKGNAFVADALAALLSRNGIASAAAASGLEKDRQIR